MQRSGIFLLKNKPVIPYEASKLKLNLTQAEDRISIDSPVYNMTTSYDFDLDSSVGSLDDNSGHFSLPAWGNCSPPQGGKRCGIIFVELSGDVTDINSVSFIIVRGRTSNIWSFAKGRMQSETENEEECAIREVREETGIIIRSIKGLPRIVIGRNVYFILHTTKKEYGMFTIQDNFEVAEVGWKTIREIKKLTANKDIRAVIRYPTRIFPYHKHIYLSNPYSPIKLTRAKYSFTCLNKFMTIDEPSIQVVAAY